MPAQTSLRLTRAILAVAAVMGLTGASAQAAGRKPVIELFTSQGCSSCPPADEVLAQLAAEGKVIALSLPVDYWDYLGWKDTFAKPEYTARQRSYSLARGDRQVYTPQAVINGQQHANGASRREIAQAIEISTQAARDVPVSLVRTADGVTVTLAAGAASTATVVAMPFLARREVAIGRGENARRKVTYTNIVREIVPLGAWTGGAATFKVPRSVLDGADGVAVIVQAGSKGSDGAILGAADLAIR
jgi:hypothetical protein